MSNLIKSVYFNVEKNNTKKINADKNVKKVEFPSINNIEGAPDNFEFVPGINVINIEDIIEEQKANVNENASHLIEDARKEADKIISKAKEDAVGIRESAKEDGYNEGFASGMTKAQQQLEIREQELSDKEELMNEQYNSLLAELEPEFATVIGGLVEKITGVVVKETDVLHYLLDRTIKQLPVSDRYIVHVCADDYAEVISCKDELLGIIPEDAYFDIVEDASLVLHQCIVETPTHMLDCGIDTQLAALKQELQLMSIK